ncbi:MAG TPA: DUF134 domain-containing protein [Vicinamibacteria bacterium]|nr:DUF134 domain-containing protein [Vicinamibacteria bacterium]
MPRPPCPRRVAAPPRCSYFKPAGIPMTRLEEVALSVDELEALRLADLEGLYQDDAAARMGVSRPTFARVVEVARRKVAEALVRGRALRIGGGPVAFVGERRFRCEACRHEWSLPFGTGRPEGCPDCRSEAFRRTDAGPRGGAGVRHPRR